MHADHEQWKVQGCATQNNREQRPNKDVIARVHRTATWPCRGTHRRAHRRGKSSQLSTRPRSMVITSAASSTSSLSEVVRLRST